MEFIALVIALVAVGLARKADMRTKELAARLAQFESAQGFVPPPSPFAPGQPAPSIAPETAQTVPPPLPVDGPAYIERPASAVAENSMSPPVPPVAAPSPGFEERIGTRWVVWIGGLTLALGGLFLVKYSIEAGLLGPEVRVLLGGLFALALLATGEVARRKENLSSIAAIPAANIPAILTAAGTAVAHLRPR